MRISVAAAIVCLSTIGISMASDVEAAINLATKATTNIPAQGLGPALQSLAKERSFELLYLSDLVDSLNTSGATGDLTADEALRELLRGTGLTYRYLDDNTVTVFSLSGRGQPSSLNGPAIDATTRMLAAAPVIGGADAADTGSKKGWLDRFRLAQNTGGTSAASAETEKSTSEGQDLPASVETTKGIPEVLVEGSKVLNMDIPRTRDDPQPYVILGREQIEASGVTTLHQFLKQRLPMNTTVGSPGQSGPQNTSSINLRGLGDNQTLILIDGRRAPLSFAVGSLGQPDVNGIPLAAVERIEVLPATASGIYGGGATGGVINIIMRRNFTGLDAQLSYENVFGAEAAARRVDLTSGLSLEGGKTTVLLSGSYSDQDPLLVWDRDFAQDRRDRFLANNSGNYESLNTNGGPPIGATPNVRSVSGANLVLDNGTALNSPITYVPAGYAGASSDGGAALIPNAGQYNIDWGNTAAPTGGGRAALLNGPTIYSFGATVRREFGARVQAFADVGASRNHGRFPLSRVDAFGFVVPAGASTNPFQQDVRVNASLGINADDEVDSHTRRAAAGVIVKLSADWTTGLDYTWNESYQTFDSSGAASPALNQAISSGTLDILRDTNAFPIDTSGFAPLPGAHTLVPNKATLKDVALRLSGPTYSLAAGPTILSALFEHRDEAISEGSVYLSAALPRFAFPARSQTVDSAYLELRAPLVSGLNSIRAIEALDLLLSGRLDKYTTHGATLQLVNPTPTTPVAHSRNQVSSSDFTLAIRYQPLQDVTLRASYGTGFLPPNVNQILSTPSSFPQTVTDPFRGNTAYAMPAGSVLSGGNPDLRPEESESFSAGVILTPRMTPGLRVSLDYTKVKKTDNIRGFPGGTNALIASADLVPGRVTRGANLPGDPPGWLGPITAIDQTLFNIASASLAAFDLQLDYEMPATRFGQFNAYAIATRQTHLQTQTLTGQPILEQVDYAGGPAKLKANGGITWRFRQWTAGWDARYFNSFWAYTASDGSAQRTINIRNQGGDRVSSELYHDVYAKYQFGHAESGSLAADILADLQVTVGVKNVFNTAPAFEGSALPVYYNKYGDPRLATYYITLKRSF